MRVAIMQPYLFPYLGYFQLIHSVDSFVFYDDVNYIKNGWVDRNRILVNGQPLYFKIPLVDASSFKLIDEVEINYKLYDKWLNTFYRTLELNYKKTSYYHTAKELIFDVFNKRYSNLAELSSQSIKACLNYVGVKKEIYSSSDKYADTRNLGRERRLIEICNRIGASVYINPAGGAELYNSDSFRNSGIELLFLEPLLHSYPQKSKDFLPGLSIIDVIMNVEPNEVLNLIEKCNLIRTQ